MLGGKKDWGVTLVYRKIVHRQSLATARSQTLQEVLEKQIALMLKALQLYEKIIENPNLGYPPAN